jgi:hypothetical protein
MSTDLPGVQAVSCVKNRDTTILHSPDMRTRKEGDYYDVRNAISDVGNREYELGDTREPGLGLRVRKTTAAWALRGRLRPEQSTWRIGDTATIGIKVARQRAAEARKLLSREH